MRVTKMLVNRPVTDPEAAKAFWQGMFGLDVAFDLGWVVSLHPPGNDTTGVQLVTGDKTAPVDSDMSIGVDDVDEAYALAQRNGYEIVHPISDEEWGPRRFFVRTPDGTVVNVVAHPHDAGQR
ncbi:VOC family protein [Pseudonocardia sp.]|jgi:catechol 2,3-dioxygenase-like lactoylglutathione lyase family enzyme|uniref:VOC family protein n=1 Tax=Pseudonocardia sp. TaxID=60912 RepID=UPI003D1146B7